VKRGAHPLPLGLLLLLLGVPCGVLHAQAPPFGEPTGRPGEPPPFQREEPRPIPPPPILQPLPPPPPTRELPLSRERVFVREIRVVGSTVFSAEELKQVAAPYINRELTAEDLEALRVALTLLYVNQGYVNSGAILPDQTVSEGIITYQIIEGELTGITIEGNRWFRAGYLRRRLSLGAGPPLNVNALQRQLQLLLEDPRIARLNADLKAGLKPGESDLDVRVEDRSPFKLYLEFNNYQSPTVGAERGIVTLEDQNLTGNGDILTLRYGKSEGVDPLLDFAYSLPLTARDTTLSLQYRRNTFTVIEEQFKVLNIESNSEIYTVTLRQPVLRTLADQVALELTGERLSNETSLLGRPFSLSSGAQNGEEVATAIRAAQEWVHRTQAQVLAVRSRFSLGIDALGATLNNHHDRIPDSRFFAWLGQFQWVQRLPLLDMQLIFRSDLQLSANPLLVLEQVAVGGRYSVRGYRENTLVRDNAFLTSLEARLPLVRASRWADYLELAPFVDYGRGWQTSQPTPEVLDIASVGIGLRWAATLRVPFPVRPQLEVYWGVPLRNLKTPGGNLQDMGLHLQFILAAF
jgi:hemolysin activation/secretion protein